ncbi:MAG: SPOR domain-containing protein, partial [Pacificimonas sp.]
EDAAAVEAERAAETPSSVPPQRLNQGDVQSGPARAPAAEFDDPPPPPTGAAAVQLGAFSTPAQANSAWDKMSGRYPYIAALTKSVEAVAVGGRTLYRLRATGLPDRAAAVDVCNRLKLAGESCVVP